MKPTDEEIDKASKKYVSESDLTTFESDDNLLIAEHHFFEGAKWARDQQPKLKPIDWRVIDNGYRAYTKIGTYYALKDMLVIIHDGKSREFHSKSVEESKQLAQADYERRINELYI